MAASPVVISSRLQNIITPNGGSTSFGRVEWLPSHAVGSQPADLPVKDTE
jgi:hypothetical protein